MTEEQKREVIDLYQGGKYEGALAILRGLDEEPSDNPEISYYLGLCYTKMEDYDRALLYLEQAVVHHWNLLQVYQSRLILSFIYTVTRRYRLAKFELDRLLEGGYESPQVFAAFSYVSYALGNVDESLSYLQKALALDPDNANALNSLGYIMADQGLDSATALNYTRAALAKDPENPAYLDSLGWALYKAGREDEAKQHLKKALSLSGGHKVIADHMRTLLDG